MGSSHEPPNVRPGRRLPLRRRKPDASRPSAKDQFRALWRRDRGVYVATSILVALLVAICLSALGILLSHWDEALPAEGQAIAPAREIELIRVCLQVIGVGVVGAVVALAAGTLESARRTRTERAASYSEQLEIRSSLTGRATTCAQRMFVTCQHIRREQRDASQGELEQRTRRLRATLDERYLEFSTEAHTLQTLIEVRYHAPQAPPSQPLPPDEAATPDRRPDSSSAARPPASGMNEAEPSEEEDDAATRPLPQPEDVGWRWHQIHDLLTVYYFSLTGNFRRNVLTTNSLTPAGSERVDRWFHSGLDFNQPRFRTPMDANDDPEVEPQAGSRQIPAHDEIESAIQEEFPQALTEFATALSIAEVRDPWGSPKDR